MALRDIQIGITEHVEGAAADPSKAIYDTVGDLVIAADRLGVRYAWFAEHHAHAHRGHLPTPLLFALHLAGRTKQIALGAAVICLNHHRWLDVAEQVAVADLLCDGRMAVGFGSGSTPLEAALFDAPAVSEAARHARFAEALQSIQAWWSDSPDGVVPASNRLPRPTADLYHRCWSAVNSVGAAAVAGARNLNVLWSHLRTPEQYRSYAQSYRAAGGRGLIAANRPIVIAATDDEAQARAEPSIRRLWRRFREEGKIDAQTPEPIDLAGLVAHPLNFICGGPESVAREIAKLHASVPFDVLNVELTWDRLAPSASHESLQRLMTEVVPLLAERDAIAAPGEATTKRGGTLSSFSSPPAVPM